MRLLASLCQHCQKLYRVIFTKLAGGHISSYLPLRKKSSIWQSNTESSITSADRIGSPAAYIFGSLLSMERGLINPPALIKTGASEGRGHAHHVLGHPQANPGAVWLRRPLPVQPVRPPTGSRDAVMSNPHGLTTLTRFILWWLSTRPDIDAVRLKTPHQYPFDCLYQRSARR